MFNKTSYDELTIEPMQPSVETLYRIAREKRDLRNPTAVARYIGVSQQTLKNWEHRGISKEGALKVQATLGMDSNHLLSLNTPEPTPPPEPHQYSHHNHKKDTVVIVATERTPPQPTAGTAWPFRHLTASQWHNLTEGQQAAVESVAIGYLSTGAQLYKDPPATKSAA